ncbi:hypothetical protein BX616_002405 [Lobosporangium transversale]|uniref:CRAL-TRIO domain-containing protein n=1 Tax=Lobosporangium transversale TaxID=64571 RepID=A0A1Y2H0L2_9FUNG|nr:CRAL-TRIO domain-containing protein [Lobosporangium transversale]KAF9919057.1 hypothetical protein BX616_002405 [Lobosporangium transversale]ORZ27263.1 CRAL-TRIO domain-containing protein [Lobosporangium transversale]|eukprot:XP_021884990.1 CRAL-TRIO domain-containing protein [Lobosporangium transversale]
MSVEDTPTGTGHVGTLTPDQIKTLKKLWAALYELLETGTVTIVSEPAATPAPAPAPAATSGWGGGWFGASTPAAPAEPVVEPPKTITLAEIGLTAEEVRTSLWNNVLSDNPDSLVLRFLRARKWHIANGLLMMLNAFKWRLEQNVEDVKTLSDDELDAKYPKFKQQLEMGKFYIHGTDKHGQPIVYINVQLHRAGDQDPKTLERLTIYLMESGRLLIQPPVETVALIFDLTNFGLGNMDYSLVQFIVKCFEAYYPESLGAILVHNAPLVFWGVWKVIEPWLDPVVASKIKFTYKNQELLELIPAEHLPDTYQGAGLDKFKYEYLAPVPGENDLMKDETTKAALQKEWDSLTQKYDSKTKEWIQSEKDTPSHEREDVAAELRAQYFKMEPYIRARNHFHRKDQHGKSILQSNGTAIWTYNN